LRIPDIDRHRRVIEKGSESCLVELIWEIEDGKTGGQ
jgi:hypothetical protein